MPRATEHDVAPDLVGEDPQIVTLGDRGELLELRGGPDLADWIERVAQTNHFGARADQRGELIEVDLAGRGITWPANSLTAGNLDRALEQKVDGVRDDG